MPVLRLTARRMVVARAVLIHNIVLSQNTGERTMDCRIVEHLLEHGDFGKQQIIPQLLSFFNCR